MKDNTRIEPGKAKFAFPSRLFEMNWRRLRPFFKRILPNQAQTLNQGKFLERTIHSVLGQQYPYLEYILQDGGSTDETGEILERYRAKLMHVESRADAGQANAINLGFRHATGEIMAWLNADDVLLPGAIAYEEKARLRFRCHGREISDLEARHQIRHYMLKHQVYQTLYRWKLLPY